MMDHGARISRAAINLHSASSEDEIGTRCIENSAHGVRAMGADVHSQGRPRNHGNDAASVSASSTGTARKDVTSTAPHFD
jgi:hypothetical protein